MAISLVSCNNDYITYRTRSIDTKKVIIFEHQEVNGLNDGDTIQLQKSVSYPYNWEIQEGATNFSDTTYVTDYKRANGDTAYMLIANKVVVIEKIIY